ncbi:MAG: DUF4390 domain-containing protein [Gammaproteobacteria bacterium]|nr:DUF4390 domain-containing protein [Gammaproteobacteria bacterium]
MLLFGGQGVHAGNISIHDARTAIINDIVHLDLDLDLEFNPDVIEALRSGIAIEFAIDIEFNRPRWYWLNAEVARGKHRFRISFLPLSEQYLLTNVVTGDRQTLPSFDDVITALGTLRSLPLAEVSNFKAGRKYRCAVQVRLDIEALPAPMRPLAYFSRAWRMASDWFEWDFQL